MNIFNNEIIRNTFKSNPFLFWFWYKSYRSKNGLKINWFSDKTDFYFDGYPRSGNTYLLFLLSGIYKNNHIVHHFHAIAPLKIALGKDLKSIIIIRNPADAISSNYLKTFEKSKLPESIDRELLFTLTKDYTNYYRYVFKKLDQLMLIDFKKLITEPENTIILINRYLDRLCDLNDKNIEQILIKRKEMSFGSKTELGSSLPNETKDKLKLHIKESLKKIKEFKFAEELYKSLTMV